MKSRVPSLCSIAVCLTASLLLPACGSPAEQATPTIAVEQIQTEAVATFSAQLTATAFAMPTSTPTETPAPTAMPTSPPVATNTVAPTAAVTSPAASCNGLAYVADLTIPDNTSMTPGQQFTKTWQLRNSGSCAWQAGFSFRLVGGEAMGGGTVQLQNAVEPGDTMDLSVSLTAPTAPGTYRGNWRMADAGGIFFGDEVYVLIVVGGTAATATPDS